MKDNWLYLCGTGGEHCLHITVSATDEYIEESISCIFIKRTQYWPKPQHCQDHQPSRRCTLPDRNSDSDPNDDSTELKRKKDCSLFTRHYEVHNRELSYKTITVFMSAFNLFEVTKSSFSPDSGFSVPDGSSDSLSPEHAKKGHASEPHNQVHEGTPVSSERLDYTSNLFSSFFLWSNDRMIRNI